jgi:hypothetical protein
MTPKQLSAKADKIAELYVSLQSNIISRIIAAIKSTKFGTVTQDNVLLYQAEQLNKMGMLTDQIIDLLAKTTGRSKAAITEMVEQDGMAVSDDITSECQQLTGKQVDISRDNQQLLNSLQRQTFKSIDNVINQSLVSRNIQDNAALRSFQKILTQSTIETLSGLKTHDRAISDSVYKLVNSGLPTNLVDKAGHQWSLEGYSRMVLQTTAHRTYNDTRMNGMDHYGVTLALMSSHPASREACAPIQGHVINQVPNSDPRYNPKYDSLYNHGYGTPAGTEGINCRHILYPFVEGVSTNTLPKPPDPDEAIENGKQQQRQRLLERTIRKDKQLLKAAEELGDSHGVAHYRGMLANHRKALRDHIASHEFLHRDYSREKIFDKTPNAKRATASVRSSIDRRYDKAKAVLGKHAPSYDEYREIIKNPNKVGALQNDLSVIKYINRPSNEELYNDKQRKIAIEAYFSFKKDGVLMSDHAISRYTGRMRRNTTNPNAKASQKRKNGQFQFNYQSILKLAKTEPNYVDVENGRLIHFRGKMAIIEEKDRSKVVTMMPRSRPKKYAEEVQPDGSIKRKGWKPIESV